MSILKFKNPDTGNWDELDVANDGVTFIPSISEDGTLSWSNNGSLENPEPVVLDNNSVVIKDDRSEFPVEGNINLLYIERKTNIMFRWEKTTKKYIAFPTGGEGNVEISTKEDNILQYDEEGKLYVPPVSEEYLIALIKKIIEQENIDFTNF